MTPVEFARLEELLDAEQAAAKRFSQYASFAKDQRLREVFLQNRDHHEARCVSLRQALRG